VATFLEEFVNPRIDDLDRKNLGQLSEGLGCAAADARHGAVASGHLNAKRLANYGHHSRIPAGPGLIANPAEDNQALASEANKTLRATSAKRPTSAKKKDGLEQGRFTRPIATPNEILPRMEWQLGVLYAPDVIDN